MAQVGIVVGSASDLETMKLCKETLESLGVETELRVLSAHRSPEETCKWASSAESRGLKILIAAAGLAAHLAGIVSAHTKLPVLGVPLEGSSLGGLDSLLSTVQMPKGTPVATFAIGKAGAVNAALFAARILALSDKALATKVEAHRERLKQEVLNAKV